MSSVQERDLLVLWLTLITIESVWFTVVLACGTRAAKIIAGLTLLGLVVFPGVQVINNVVRD